MRTISGKYPVFKHISFTFKCNILQDIVNPSQLITSSTITIQPYMVQAREHEICGTKQQRNTGNFFVPEYLYVLFLKSLEEAITAEYEGV